MIASLSAAFTLLSPATARAEGDSVRARRPNVLTGIVGLPGGIGIDYGHNFSEPFSLGARASMWPPFLLGGFLSELAVDGRWFFLGGEQWSLYLEASLGALVGSATAFALGTGVSSSFALPRLGTVIGFEWRSAGGFTAGLSFGNNLFYVPGLGQGQGPIVPSPTGYLQIGSAF
ncbi:MAG TPA: hypothetical protein VFA20_06550 [Myxococcaceae bacterium]|nr:hypothetical protein [Myxococcaceae bacterium]